MKSVVCGEEKDCLYFLLKMKFKLEHFGFIDLDYGNFSFAYPIEISFQITVRVFSVFF